MDTVVYVDKQRIDCMDAHAHLDICGSHTTYEPFSYFVYHSKISAIFDKGDNFMWLHVCYILQQFCSEQENCLTALWTGFLNNEEKESCLSCVKKTLTGPPIRPYQIRKQSTEE